MSAFSVKTPRFEGPLELLYTLIEERKFHINDLSLSRVADDYISYVRGLQDFPIADTAQFILVASTLALIKSKSLLPGFELSYEEEEEVGDLERRLQIYSVFKEAAAGLLQIAGRSICYGPFETRPFKIVFSPHPSITKTSLAEAIKNIVASFPKFELIPEAVVRAVISLEEMMDKLSRRISENLRLGFHSFSGATKAARQEVIVGFLALLELIKRGVVKAEQAEGHGEITMENDMPAIPRYNVQ